MQDFLFKPEQARAPLRILSGGERARLMLARALTRPSNLLVLDEPTNDLDLETLDLLQEMIGEYQGTVLVISHDRDFLDRVATSIIMSEGDGRWTDYAGGYSDMVAQRGTGVERKAVERSARVRPEPEPVPARGAKRRLSFKEKHALETLPAKIDALAAQAAQLQARLADPGLFGRDPGAFNETGRKLAEIEARKMAAEEEWLTLEMLREEIEG